MLTAILTIVAGLIAALPQILKFVEARLTKRNEVHDAVVDHSLDELHAGRDRVRALQQTPSSVQPDRPPAEL